MEMSIWTKKIKENLSVLADLDRQRRGWLEYDESADTVSWDEEICDLFDSNLFEDFLEENKGTMKSELYVKLEEVKNELDAYKGLESNKDILHDERWIKISKKVKEALELWNQA